MTQIAAVILVLVFFAIARGEDFRVTESHDLDHPAEFVPRFADREQWEKRASEVREQILVAMGLWPMPEKSALALVIHGRIEREGYTVEKVSFASWPGHYVTGNLYRPTGRSGKLPAVLSPHGHWPKGRFFERTEAEAKKQIEAGAERTMEGARYPLQARCAMLARMGCVVFFYDMVGMGDSGPIAHGAGFADAEAALRLQSAMGLQAWNSIRALDFLCGLADVDAKRVAVTGASGGGTQTMILCAIDPRPAVAFPAVMVSTAMQGGCVCENSPLLRIGTNNVEFAALFAPKPLGMTGANDWTREIETRGLPELKTVYGLYGAQDKVMAKYFSFQHNYNQVSRELMYNWMNVHLGLGWEGVVKEKAFVPVAPAELSVFDEKHRRPGDGVDAAGLRRTMSEASDGQMAAMANDPGAYRRVVGTALAGMVHDRMPDAHEIVVEKGAAERIGDGIAVERGVARRRGTGEEVQYVILTPAGWSGAVVVWASRAGKAGVFNSNGQLTGAVASLLGRRAAVLAGDLFLTGAMASSATTRRTVNEKYCGFTFGYNRTILAERVHDVLTLIAVAHHADHRGGVHLIGVGEAGPWALVARAMAGKAVARAAIDLNGFDFDRVRSVRDEMMLPGALKYGGVAGLGRLCGAGTLLFGAARPMSLEPVVVREAKAHDEELARWVVP